MAFNNFLKFNNTAFEQKKENKEKETPTALRIYGEKVIDLFCKKFSTEGFEDFKSFREANQDEKFIITAAHLNNLDVPAALKVWGKDFNLQVTGESVLLEKIKYLGHRLMINLGGRENFTPLDYKEDSSGKRGSFNPDNFIELEEKMKNGKTPWIAAHPFSLDGKMRQPSIGPVYLAAKTKSTIIPTALDVSGGSVNLEGALESAKTLTNRSSAVYRIGQPLKLEAIDVSIIEDTIEKRHNNQEITQEEMTEFSSVHRQLKEQAEILSNKIAELLPPDKRKE